MLDKVMLNINDLCRFVFCILNLGEESEKLIGGCFR